MVNGNWFMVNLDKMVNLVKCLNGSVQGRPDSARRRRIFDIYDLEFANLGLLALSPCCAAAYDMQTEMSSSPAGGLC